jgi:exodeoxyribonuclease-5
MLTREQHHVHRQLVRNRHRDQVQTLGGFAGTGKTTVLAALAEALPDWAPCAFTGRAAHVMRGKGVGRARTIHGTIYTPSLAADGGRLTFRLRDRAELGHLGGFLVDEASMVGRDLHDDLLSFGLPVIFVGDHGQLPPVGSEVNLMKAPTYRLETVHRNAGEIAFFAEHLREGRHPRSFRTGGAVRLVSQRWGLDDELLRHAGQVIVAFNRTRVGINANARRLKGFTGLLQPGERVICLRNHYPAGLFNGMTGKVLKVDTRHHVLDFQSGGTVYGGLRYDPDTFGAEKPEVCFDPDSPHPFEYAYAVTAHKAQGGEWGRVTVIEGWCPYWEPRRWAYTAASRARHSLVWVTAPHPVPVAARGHATTERRL